MLQNHQTKPSKYTSALSEARSGKHNFPVWQITLPLCGVLICAIGAITTVYMINGRYFFHLKATPKEIDVR
ncbi:hypothetical protein [Moorena sp. SIO4G3]|uniref:hypothetical protein n=1 Tax=Moorena sp. SIO4G3 TaxID=2607821 RepID=UPI00142D0D34|nr:hypothetical protein [Moorena sp. SIO4G3]NEO76255.1 hypothetical protein [Moorena sp. SIO4G3]